MSQILRTEHRGTVPWASTVEDQGAGIGRLISEAVDRAVEAAGPDQTIVDVGVSIGDVVATHIGEVTTAQLYEITLETRLR